MVKFYVALLEMLTIVALFYDSEASSELYCKCVEQLFTQLEEKINDKNAKIVAHFKNCMELEKHKKKDYPDIKACGRATLDVFTYWITLELTQSEFQTIVTEYENLLKTKANENGIAILYDQLDDKLEELKNKLPTIKKPDITKRVKKYNSKKLT